MKYFFYSFFSAFIAFFGGVFLVEILFRKGPFFIIIYSAPFGCLICLILSIILVVFHKKKNFLNYFSSHVIIIFLIVLSIVLYGWNKFYYTPKDLVFKYITSTIPASMKDINGTIEYPAIDHIIRVKFQINDKDYKAYILKKQYNASTDTFPYTLPIVESHEWWNIEEIKKLQQYKADYNNGIHYLWYNRSNNQCFFMRIRSIKPKSAFDLSKSTSTMNDTGS